MARHALVIQCGAPTAVVNASLAGVLDRARSSAEIRSVRGARHGLRGLRTEPAAWADLTGWADARLEFQPGALLGGGRDRLSGDDIAGVIDRLRRAGIDLLFVIGGNGSMSAAAALDQAARAGGHDLGVIGIPKTIDNDLAATDVSPGYGSAARFVAQSVRDAGLDLASMRGFDAVAIVEVMGRHVGWLAAASVLARYAPDAPPHLVLLPEVPLDEARFLAAVERRHREGGLCVVVTAEGIADEGGAFLAEKTHAVERDPSGQKLLGIAGGPAPYLASLVRAELGLRVRQVRPDVLQRSSSALASEVDRRLARRVGEEAVSAALAGARGVMVALVREGTTWQTRTVPLEQTAGRQKLVPPELIAPGFDVAPAFERYARPLVGEWSARVVELTGGTGGVYSEP
jgi:6-phosphofructokinase 1